ncbi:hypothetical protein AQ490_12290 [Wenjunlia vitaminophila]|uniref:Uncharacterized protein n=1 Tax=Wenjunlia vitaminophila TaxID=76728 RepID=A0A0T6LLB9_WENVI|nr:hypothetical protein [Wenjunlia vitaminophila]KRV46642.1 hypothetical protein AQ490_12290 [Wenjunlia vitaminophila]
MTDGAVQGPPTDYRLLLPEDWFRIDLEPGRRDRSVRALVDRQFRGLDDAPLVKQRVREEMLAHAEKAYRGGGIELYLGLQSAGPMPLPASLVVTLAAPDPGGAAVPVDAFAEYLKRQGPSEREVTVEDLPAGPSVRARLRTVPTEDAGDAVLGNTLPVTSLDYHVPVPRSTAFLLLSFSTPLDALADAMVDLFDAVAGSLRWKE